MKNKIFSWLGGMGAVIGMYLIGMYFYDYVTMRFIPVMKQFLFILN